MKGALTALLLADPDLQTRVGTRISWNTPPAHAAGFPCLNLTMVSAPLTYTLDGEAGTQSCTAQVDAWAQSASEAEALRWEVRSLLSGYRGVTGGVRFRGAFVMGSRDLDGRGLGDLAALFGVSIDLRIRWSVA